MSDSDRSDVRALKELETLVRHLGEELVTFRRRALQAEGKLKGDGAPAVRSSVGDRSDRVAELEKENAALRERLARAQERVSRALERVHFIRQQAQAHPTRGDGKA